MLKCAIGIFDISHWGNGGTVELPKPALFFWYLSTMFHALVPTQSQFVKSKKVYKVIKLSVFEQKIPPRMRERKNVTLWFLILFSGNHEISVVSTKCKREFNEKS